MMDMKDYLPAGDPKKLLRTVISISVVLLVIWLFAVSRMEYRSGPGDEAAGQRVESVQRIMNGDEERAPVARESSRIFMNALTTFTVMVILLAAVWYWSRRKPGPSSSARYFREIGQHGIAPGQQLKILEINEEIWVLAIGSSGTTLLHRYPAGEWKEPQEPAAPSTRTESNFYKMFRGKS
jgi:flagellar biogenesis protein FliO